jgi:hypothetical protein
MRAVVQRIPGTVRAPLVVTLVGIAELALAQPHFRSDKPPARAFPQGAPVCAGFTVDAQVAIRRATVSRDSDVDHVDFVVTASVGNPCDEPLQIRQGTALSYETNFPFTAGGAGQPPSCQSREFPFAGVVPPRSQQPFTLSVRSCAVDADTSERPTVRVASGRILTDRGERSIPSTSQSLP